MIMAMILSNVVISSHISWESWLARILVEFLILIGYLSAYLRRVFPVVISQAATDFEFDSLAVSAFQSTHHALTPSSSLLVADNGGFIIMEGLDLEQASGSSVLILGFRIS
jgi:hypothetical protein